MTIPLVSVCIPTYNQAEFISDTLKSVLRQNYGNIEIIVVDDCSNDTTMEIVEALLEGENRATIDRNRSNLGMVKNWNRCLNLAKGKYIKFVFGDDLLSVDDSIADMVRIMESSDRIALVASSRAIIDSNAKQLSVVSSYLDNFLSDGRKVIRNCFNDITRVHNPIGEPSAVMFRRDFSCRGFNECYNQLVDIEMWFHLLEQGDFAYIAKPLCSFRQHKGQQTVKNIESMGFIDDILMLFDDYLHKPYVGMGILDRTYLRYYQLYKLLKHAKQGKFPVDTVNEKINDLYGAKRFASMGIFYRLYSPCWNIRKKIGSFFRAA